MRHQPVPALFVTATTQGQLTHLSVWTPDAHLAGRANDLGMAAAIASAVVTKHGSALISGEDGRCVLTRSTARRYLDTIETWGYQPTEAEQAQRLAAANQQMTA
ncbi:MAG: hypothetical protein AB7V43_13940 [Acidimicrobiia bacterium]